MPSREIEALIARVESAEGPDRDIDIDLCLLAKDYSDRAYAHYCHQAPRGKTTTVRVFLSDRLSSRYSGSPDAIVGLIEREFPDWMWGCIKMSSTRAEANIGYVNQGGFSSVARTPALALCAAFLQALRALSKAEERTDGR